MESLARIVMVLLVSAAIAIIAFVACVICAIFVSPWWSIPAAILVLIGLCFAFGQYFAPLRYPVQWYALFVVWIVTVTEPLFPYRSGIRAQLEKGSKVKVPAWFFRR